MVHTVRPSTSGRVAVDSRFIGRDTRRATFSGYIWPRRLGTSSPKMMVSTVMMKTTRPVAVMAAAFSAMPKVAISHCASGAAKALLLSGGASRGRLRTAQLITGTKKNPTP